MSLSKLSEQEEVRLAELAALRALGIEPYPSRAKGDLTFISHLRAKYSENAEAHNVRIAGRLLSKRIMGKASFAELQDSTGRIQLYLNRDELPNGHYNEVFKKHLSRGDFIGVAGRIGKTQTGELTLFVSDLEVLSKAIKPLPVVKRQTDAEGHEQVFDAFADPEQCYRQRYVDLVVNPEKKAIFRQRAKLIQCMRAFLDKKDYLEVETPILQPIWGGATARPFVTHHATLDMPLYLRIAKELYLKRLIVGGLEGVYEIGKDFRNEGMSRYHNPEFTQLELYVAYMDYQGMMALTEQLIANAAQALLGSTKCPLGKDTLDFKLPWKRYRFYELLQEATKENLAGAPMAQLKRVAKAKKVSLEGNESEGKLLDKLFGTLCEPQLIQPCFVMDYPLVMSPLAKQHLAHPHLVERFEAFCMGREFANAYSELNDPIEQRKRFELQQSEAKKGDPEAIDRLDEDYVSALAYGMPPTAGLGIGIDRLIMLLTQQKSIQDVLFFPQMRPAA